MVDWVCRWKPCWVLIKDTFKKAYFEDWQLVKDGQNYDPVEDATQSILFAADSARVRRSENNDGTVKHEPESAKLLKSGCNDVNFKHVQS